MPVEKHIPLLEKILGEWKNEIGNDYIGYKNHVYRMINFCFAQKDFSEEERRKIILAGCFHDLGIWSDKTFDYIPPSIELAKNYLQQNDPGDWTDEISLMIGEHHKLGKFADSKIVEIFRKGDLVDLSLGFVKCGLSKNIIKTVKNEFPNAGFHKCLLRVSSSWIFRHPLNPVPVLKW